MNSLRQPKLRNPGVVLGVISGFPVHDNYPVEDGEKLDKLVREEYFTWKAMSCAAISRFATNRPMLSKESTRFEGASTSDRLLLTVKGNQPTVRAQIETLVTAPQGDFPPS